MEPNEPLRPRVFISCGQRDGTDEPEIARRIAQLLERLGFEPYVAVQEQSLRGLKENIFARLSESEYFLFVDFKRERIGRNEFRGSLFSHQELAIASFLDIPVLAYRERGVRKLDGLIQFLQANCSEFSSREGLTDQIEKDIRAKWQTGWRNQLRLTRNPDQFGDESHLGYKQFPKGRPVRYFHVRVVNDHRTRTAFNCFGYLQHIKELPSGATIQPPPVEYKWRGAMWPAATIPFRGSRELDAFFVYHDEPASLYFGTLTDSPRHQVILLSPGQYELTFAVHSGNFPYAASVFELRFGGKSVNDITFVPKEVPKRPMKHLTIECANELEARLRQLVEAGWFDRPEDAVLEALRRFLSSHSVERQEQQTGRNAEPESDGPR